MNAGARAASAWLLAAAALLGGCAHAPRMAQPLAGMDVSRDLVLAVENPIAAPAPHAGSNLLGYGSADQYRNGQRASATLAALKREYALRELAGWPIKPLGLYCAVLRPAPGADREALLQALGRDARVRLVEPLHEYSLYSQPAAGERYNDPYVGLQRGFADIHAAQAQRVSRGNGVEVALVDTGVDRSHPDLAGRIRAVHDLVQAPDGGTADRHGTEVAGVIAAVGNNHLGIVGVAPEATLSVYRACWGSADGKGARCNTFTLAKALAALADSPARIVNMSLGGPEDPLLSMLLGTLLREGRVVVAALPPTGMVEGFPAAVPGVIVVGPAAPARSAAGVVNAPGVDILTTQPRGGYDFASGSSLAAAHVSGVAALLLSLAPDLDARVVRGILARSSAVQAGNGALVNAAAAVGLVGGPTARAARR